MSPVRNRRVSRLVGWLLAVFVLVVGGGLGAAPAYAEGEGSISGVVTDSTGAPAASVQVASYTYDAAWGSWRFGPSTLTNADGSYALSGLADGGYRIQFSAIAGSANLISEWWDGAADVSSATTLTLSGGTDITGISPILDPGATIAGVVTDESGAPVRGVSVRAGNAATGTQKGLALTDAAGAYRLTGLATGDYVVEFAPLADSGALVGEWWDDARSRTSATVISVAAGAERSGVDATLSAAGSIGGIVTDSTGAAAANTYVSIYRATASGADEWVDSRSTDSAGAYTVPRLAAGDYKVQFSASGALLSEWFDDAADAASAARVTVVAGAATPVDAELTIGASITGVVTDEAGQPVANATVWTSLITPDGLMGATGTSTAEDGSYSVVGLKPGAYKVRFETAQASPNVAGEWWHDAQTEQSATVVELSGGEVAADISPRLAPGAQISGTVIDGAGAPISGAEVAVHDVPGTGASTSVWTGTDGTYTARGLDAGAYRLEFIQFRSDGTQLREWWNNAPDAASADDIVVSVGQSVGGIDVKISEDDGSVVETHTASISGRVTDPSGAPIESAAVSVLGLTLGDGAQTGADGSWSLGRLPAGSYTVQFSAEIDGEVFTQWWEGSADSAAATAIVLKNAEQRIGIDAVLGDAPDLPALQSSTPKITGQPRVGATLKVQPGKWTKGAQFTYEWFADGEAIPGEVRSTLHVKPELIGARITVEVTGAKEGYQSVSQSSQPTSTVPQPRSWELWLYRLLSGS